MLLKHNTGYLFTIENLDGLNTEPYIKSLMAYFQENRYDVELIRYDDTICNTDRIHRALYLTPNLDNNTEILLAFSRLNEICHKRVIDALADGKIVIYEKYVDFICAKYAIVHSAFNILESNLPKTLMQAHKNVELTHHLAKSLHLPKPHKTFYIKENIANIVNKLDLKRPDFISNETKYLTILEKIYFDLMKKEKSRFLIVDGDKMSDDFYLNKLLNDEFIIEYNS